MFVKGSITNFFFSIYQFAFFSILLCRRRRESSNSNLFAKLEIASEKGAIMGGFFAYHRFAFYHFFSFHSSVYTANITLFLRNLLLVQKHRFGWIFFHMLMEYIVECRVSLWRFCFIDFFPVGIEWDFFQKIWVLLIFRFEILTFGWNLNFWGSFLRKF